MQTKICSRCEKEKTLDQFHKDKRCRLGVNAWCRQCRKEYGQAYQKAHPEKGRLAVRKSYAKHKERRCREARERYDPEKRRQRYLKNRDARLAQQREYQQRPEVKARYRDWKRRWIVRNRELKREYWRRYNARKQGAKGTHSVEEWLTLCKRCDWTCLACGSRHVKDNPLTLDHIVPLSKGGTDDIDNIQPLCRSCNSAKNNKTIDYRRK